MVKLQKRALPSRTPGQGGKNSTLLMACVSVIVVLTGAAIYAVVVRYNPFVVLSFFGTVLFGLLIGTQVATTWPARTRLFKIIAALLFAVLGLWAYWLIWIALTVEHGAQIALHLARSGPLYWTDFLGRLAHVYHFSLRRKLGGFAEASTLETETAWLIEALTVIALSVFAGVSKPDYRKWTIEVCSTKISDRALREALIRGDISILYSHDWKPAPQQPLQRAWQSIEFGFDEELRTISAVMLNYQPDEAQEIGCTRSELVSNLSLAYRDYHALVQHLSANMGRKD